MHGEGPMLVIAGPGSGKTFTITQRISYLIEKRGIDPRNILVITFTKEAAMNMQERFRAAQQKWYPVNFGTFHAIFYQIIKSTGAYKTDAILTNAEKKRILTPVLKDYMREAGKTNDYHQEDLSEDILLCMTAFGYYKNTGNVTKASRYVKEEFRKDFMQLFERYECKRREFGKIDFDDILYQCLILLKDNPELLMEWQERYTYILVDEMQDINPGQYEIVKLLAGEKRNLFVVGDDDQAIYGFRGSEPTLMMQFLRDYPDSKKVTLNMNYRSHEEIVKASQKVIKLNHNRFEKELKAVTKARDTSSEMVNIRHVTDRTSQYRMILHSMQDLDRETLNQSAILFRTHSQMQGMVSLLLKEEVPFRMKEKVKCIYDHEVIQVVNHYMRFAFGDRRRSVFLKIMNKPKRCIGREALENEMVELADVVKYYREYAAPKEQRNIIQHLNILESDLNKLKELPPYLGVLFLRKKMGYERYLREKAGTDRRKLEEWLGILEQICDEVKEYDDYLQYLECQEHYRRELSQEEIIRGTEGIQLMTVHASKGLEFEHVWIPDINEGVYPYGRNLSKEAEEEERRVLYVGMTRAKKSLRLSFVTGTKERPRPVSGFLNPIMNYSSSTSSSNSQLSRYSSNASDTFSNSSSSSMCPSSGSSLGSSGFSL